MPRYELKSSLIFGKVQTDRQTDGRTDRQTESDAYEPTVQIAQVGSKSCPRASHARLRPEDLNLDKKSTLFGRIGMSFVVS